MARMTPAGQDAPATAAIVRRLLAAQAVTGFGDGLWFSLWAIFFTRIQGIPAEAMGIAVGLGGAAGLLAATPVGVLADRRGPREVLVVVIVLRGLCMAAYVLVHDFWTLLLVQSLFSAVQSSGSGVRVTLVYGLVPGDRRLRTLAQSRVVQHIAYAAGAGAAALVLAVGGRPVFVAAVLLNAATFLAAAAITVTVPGVPPVPAERRRAGTQAVRDLPYVAVMGSTTLLALCWALLSTGLPLWIAGDTSAPLWAAALAVVLSSAAIALFQVRVSRRGADVPGAVRSARVSGLALAACCAVFALAAWPGSPLVALAVVLAGVGVHVVGELYYVAAQWGLSLGLMARDAEGQYQGVTATTEAATVALGPAVVTTLLTGLHAVGWLVLAAILLAAVAPVGPLARRALRDPYRVGARPSEPAEGGVTATP
ncbi:MFS transporter [Microbispora corallina]|uniref:MFS transporter n=1 Tax=Microbispora corallina TaxID=83302 RepID=A0ABQ4G636_9ACTN|nr:MFS transporter [Microbispora corallina]GIH42502.1 MFS transporter [Microbispora corallina]